MRNLAVLTPLLGSLAIGVCFCDNEPKAAKKPVPACTRPETSENVEETSALPIPGYPFVRSRTTSSQEKAYATYEASVDYIDLGAQINHAQRAWINQRLRWLSERHYAAYLQHLSFAESQFRCSKGAGPPEQARLCRNIMNTSTRLIDLHPPYVTIRVQGYWDTGGIRGNYWTQLEVYLIGTDRKLSFRDLALSPVSLQAHLEPVLAGYLNCPRPGIAGARTHPLRIEESQIFGRVQSWGTSPNGLVFYFGEIYDLADGEVLLTVPWNIVAKKVHAAVAKDR